MFTFSKDLIEATKKWAQVGTEVVANEYLNEMLVFPLGPLVGRLWGESVAHPPEIPIRKANPLGSGDGSWNGSGNGTWAGPWIGPGGPGAGLDAAGRDGMPSDASPRTVGGPIGPGPGGHAARRRQSFRRQHRSARRCRTRRSGPAQPRRRAAKSRRPSCCFATSTTT